MHSTVKTGLIALAALGVAAAANADGLNGATTSNGLACGISKTGSGNMMNIEAVVQSPTDLDGDYRLSLRTSGGGGSSNVSQGGPFAAKAGTPASLGKVTINSGSTLDADFTITIDGKTYDCSQQYSPQA